MDLFGDDDLPRSSSDIARLDGDPASLRGCADDLRSLATDLTSAWTATHRLGTISGGTSWHGEGFDAFRTKVERNPQPGDIENAQSTMSAAAAGLDTLATGLADCQSRIEWCRQRIDALGLPADGEIPEGVRPTVAAIKADAEQARSDYDGHLRSLGASFDELTSNVVYSDPPGLFGVLTRAFDQMVKLNVEFAIGIVEGVWEMVKGVYSIGALLVQPQKWDDALRTLDQIIQYAIQDPGGFLKAVGQAVVDWDTLTSNPARWAGKLVPAIVLAIVTGGAASVAAGAGRIAVVASRMGRLSRLATKLDDVAGVARRVDGVANLADRTGLTRMVDKGRTAAVNGARRMLPTSPGSVPTPGSVPMVRTTTTATTTSAGPDIDTVETTTLATDTGGDGNPSPDPTDGTDGTDPIDTGDPVDTGDPPDNAEPPDTSDTGDIETDGTTAADTTDDPADTQATDGTHEPTHTDPTGDTQPAADTQPTTDGSTVTHTGDNGLSTATTETPGLGDTQLTGDTHGDSTSTSITTDDMHIADTHNGGETQLTGDVHGDGGTSTGTHNRHTGDNGGTHDGSETQLTGARGDSTSTSTASHDTSDVRLVTNTQGDGGTSPVGDHGGAGNGGTSPTVHDSQTGGGETHDGGDGSGGGDTYDGGGAQHGEHGEQGGTEGVEGAAVVPSVAAARHAVPDVGRGPGHGGPGGRGGGAPGHGDYRARTVKEQGRAERDYDEGDMDELAENPDWSPGVEDRPRRDHLTGPDAPGRSPAELELLDREVTRCKPLGTWKRGKNIAYKVTFADGTQAIYKPIRGENPYVWSRLETEGFQAEREVAASRLDEELRFDLVPTTTWWDGPHGPGSLQVWSKDSFGFMTTDSYDVLERERLAVFDYVAGNEDRWQENVRTAPGGRLVAIDHGIAFPERELDPTDMRKFSYFRPSDEVGADTLARLRAVDTDRLRRRLHDAGLSDRAVDGALARLQELLDTERLPVFGQTG